MPDRTNRKGGGGFEWTEAEKAWIVARALDIRRGRPDLTGLALLRSAVATLPQHRRRQLTSISQAPWFEPGMEAEAATRARSEGEDAQARQSMLALLVMIHQELADLNAKLGRPVPAQPSRTHANGHAGTPAN